MRTTLDELLQAFGREVCGVDHPAAVVSRVQEGMRQPLALAERNGAAPAAVKRLMAQVWGEGGLSRAVVLERQKLPVARFRDGD